MCPRCGPICADRLSAQASCRPSSLYRSFGDRAKKFTEGKLKKLEAERAAKRAQLDDLPDDHNAHIEETRLARALDGVALELNTRAEAHEAAKRALAEHEAELARVAAQLAAQRPELKKLEAKLQKASASVRRGGLRLH
jgi:chromosome segregation ATPase